MPKTPVTITREQAEQELAILNGLRNRAATNTGPTNAEVAAMLEAMNDTLFGKNAGKAYTII